MKGKVKNTTQFWWRLSQPTSAFLRVSNNSTHCWNFSSEPILCKISLTNMSCFKVSLEGIMLKNIFILFLVSGWTCESVTEGRYRCTLKNFIRLGNSCYFLSAEIASWQEAHFRCRDKGAQLAVLASQYEDSTLRSYLERPEFAQLGRWIGGMWATKWIWAAQGSEIENESSFASPEAFNLEEKDQWMCLYMDPNNRYRWNGENCMRQLHYICEAPLAKATNFTGEDSSATPSPPAGPLVSSSESKFTINPATEDTSSSFTTTPGNYADTEDAAQSPSDNISSTSSEE